MLGLEWNTAIVLGGTMLLGLAAGIIGTFGLLRGRALLGDALSHATLPGICLAFLLFGKHFSLLLAGALVTGVLGVFLVAFLNRYTRIKEDSNIGIVLSVFFGAGIVLLSYIQSHSPQGAQGGINSFILGKTAGMVRDDLLWISGVAVVVVVVVVLLYKEFKLLCFDPEFAAVEGWPVTALDALLMLLLALTTVIGLPAVGVVLMVALLILPAAAARFWVRGLGAMLALAGGFGMLIGALGTLVSARVADLELPAGPVIVLSGTAIFTLSMLAAPDRGLVAQAIQRARHRRRRRLQNLLRTLYEASETALPHRPVVPLTTLIGDGPGEAVTRRLLASTVRAGWVTATADGWCLTESGLARAAAVVRVHRLWEHYLLSSANIDRDLVDPDVEIIETILPTGEVLRLEAELRSRGRLPEIAASAGGREVLA